MKLRFSTETDRLEAFSDGVMAVIITIMVLDLKPPHEPTLEALNAVLPTFIAYVVSFVFIGIYWNNHHHMLRAANGIDGRVMWANLHFLFWLSLAPFMTAWVGEHPTASLPTALYAAVLFLDGIAYALLQNALIAVNGRDTAFGKALKGDVKGILSGVLYLGAIGIAFVSPFISDVLIVIVAIIWIVPERRFESVITERG
jgi:uncharacterized membrane protein